MRFEFWFGADPIAVIAYVERIAANKVELAPACTRDMALAKGTRGAIR